AESDPAGAEAVNVLGTRNVVASGAPVVYFSSDYVFDGRKTEPYVETDEPRPLGIYGRTKLAGEREVGDGWIVRSSWLHGWGATTSSARCCGSAPSATRSPSSATSAARPPTSATSPTQSGISWPSPTASTT